MSIANWQIGIFIVSALAILATGPQRAGAHDALEAPRAYTVPAAVGGSDAEPGVAVRGDHSGRGLLSGCCYLPSQN